MAAHARGETAAVDGDTLFAPYSHAGPWAVVGRAVAAGGGGHGGGRRIQLPTTHFASPWRRPRDRRREPPPRVGASVMATRA